MSQTENSNQVSLPVAGEHGSFLYAIHKVIICNFVYKVTYVTLKSCNISYRCLQLMFMTMSNILTSNKLLEVFLSKMYKFLVEKYKSSIFAYEFFKVKLKNCK